MPLLPYLAFMACSIMKFRFTCSCKALFGMKRGVHVSFQRFCFIICCWNTKCNWPSAAIMLRPIVGLWLTLRPSKELLSPLLAWVTEWDKITVDTKRVANLRLLSGHSLGGTEVNNIRGLNQIQKVISAPIFPMLSHMRPVYSSYLLYILYPLSCADVSLGVFHFLLLYTNLQCLLTYLLKLWTRCNIVSDTPFISRPPNPNASATNPLDRFRD